MARFLGLILSTLLFAHWTEPSMAQETVPCPLTISVKAQGQGTTFFQDFVFCGATTSFPGVSSGELFTGGPGVQQVTLRVAETVYREEVAFLLVFVNGRPRLQRQVRQVPFTVYREVQENRQIVLPEATGRWTSIDLYVFSSWNFYHLGPDGLVVGAGATVGEELYGSALYLGVGDLPSAWYQLSTGSPGAGDGGEGGGGNPPVEP